MRRSSSVVGAGVTARSSATLGRQAMAAWTCSSVAPGWSESRRISPVVVEVVDAQVGDHHRGPSPQPALLRPDLGGRVGPAEVAGRGPEVDPLDEAARALAHDHEDLARVDGDLAGAAGAGQAGRRVGVVADDGGVDVAEAVDLGGTQEADVDEAPLEVVAEQLQHAVTAVAPVTMVGSPMDSGRRAGRAPKTPAS